MLLTSDEKSLVRARLAYDPHGKRPKRAEELVQQWRDFLSERGYRDRDDHTLSGYLRATQVQLLILFLITLEEQGVHNTDAYVRAIRLHFRDNCMPEDIFSDWSLSQARKDHTLARQRSLRKEERLREASSRFQAERFNCKKTCA